MSEQNLKDQEMQSAHEVHGGGRKIQSTQEVQGMQEMQSAHGLQSAQEVRLGNRRLVGQLQARRKLEQTLQSGRLGHAYLLTGPQGSGKNALALAMAEWINGVDHLSDLGTDAFSGKSSWFHHPDIHFFLPLPSQTGASELASRLQLLSKDPYELVDFALRPSLHSDKQSSNRRAFYAIDYYREQIRPVTVLTPNEGRRTIVILTEIQTMRRESANAFLKLLEEPGENLMFILTATGSHQLLPTIVSRCQQIQLRTLQPEEIRDGLMRFDGMGREDAELLSRLTDGNYAMARFLDVNQLREIRGEMIQFLRLSYIQDAKQLAALIGKWQRALNLENQIALCNSMELILRDLIVFGATEDESLVLNADQLDVIQAFQRSMKDARLEEMIGHLNSLKGLLYQNVQFSLIFSVLSFRFHRLLRGHPTEIDPEEPWQHLPALRKES
jgi:DNA polymerase-3 subunit delta'